MTTQTEQKKRHSLTAFDYLAITGGMINLLVISYIIGYWFLS